MAGDAHGDKTQEEPQVQEDLGQQQAAQEQPQVRFYAAIDLLSGDDDQFDYQKAAVIKYDKHVASRVFSPDELEAPDSYMLKYCKCGIVSVLENKLDGVFEVPAGLRLAFSFVPSGRTRRAHGGLCRLD